MISWLLSYLLIRSLDQTIIIILAEEHRLTLIHGRGAVNTYLLINFEKSYQFQSISHSTPQPLPQGMGTVNKKPRTKTLSRVLLIKMFDVW